jgi:ABC-2 type transport system ATP-binding protein
VAPQQLLAALVAAEVGLRRFEVVVPTLHQIFVDRVGADAAVAQRRPDA